MPNLTPNYNLKKPIKATENADIDVLNENMDKIDTQMKANADNITTLQNKKNILIKRANILTTGWVYDSTLGVYTYKINDSDITSKDVVDINIETYYVIKGYADSLLSPTKSSNGFVTIYSSKILTDSLTGDMIIQKEV